MYTLTMNDPKRGKGLLSVLINWYNHYGKQHGREKGREGGRKEIGKEEERKKIILMKKTGGTNIR